MRASFPKFLNSNRLLYKLEYDEWIVIVSSFFILFYVFGFFLMFNSIISFLLSAYITKKITKYYMEEHKTKSPGYLFHFFYDLGFSQPSKNKHDKDNDKDIQFPFGYETEFKD